jgi:hypothetical protein
VDIEVSAVTINVAFPEDLRWTDTRRGAEFTLMTLTVRLLPSGELAVKAHGRPTAGGRGTYVSSPVPEDRQDLAALITSATDRAAAMWAAHRGLR